MSALHVQLGPLHLGDLLRAADRAPSLLERTRLLEVASFLRAQAARPVLLFERHGERVFRVGQQDALRWHTPRRGNPEVLFALWQLASRSGQWVEVTHLGCRQSCYERLGRAANGIHADCPELADALASRLETQADGPRVLARLRNGHAHIEARGS